MRLRTKKGKEVCNAEKSTILFAFVFFLLFIGLNTVSYEGAMNEKGKRYSDGIDNDGDGLIMVIS